MPRDTRQRRQPSLSPYDSRTNWTEETFIDSDEAEDALCHDRAGFILRNDIMAIIPSHIRKRMIHPDVNAHIQGFQELFVHLNKGRPPKRLRELVETYFNDCLPLRGHLKRVATQLSPTLDKGPFVLQASGSFAISGNLSPGGGIDVARVARAAEPPDLSEDASSTSEKSRAIAFAKVALQVAAAGLKAAPIPNLDQIPNTLLSLIQTYSHLASAHDTGPTYPDVWTADGNSDKLQGLCKSIGRLKYSVLRPLQCVDGGMPPAIEGIINVLRCELTSQHQRIDLLRKVKAGSKVVSVSAIADEILATEACINNAIQIFTAAASTAHLQEIVRTRIDYALSKLPVANAGYMSVTKEQCYETTRTGIHHSIMSSFNTRTSRVVWLQGSPGTGKTAIAKRIADSLANDKRLAASFFWDKTGGRANTDSIEFFPSTLASQLATFSQDYEMLLVNCLLDRSSRNILMLPLEKRMETLVIQPMSSITQAFSLAERGPVVVLDGLDECGSRDALVKLMDLVLLLDMLPPEFMILVSARPEPEIRAVLEPLHDIPRMYTDQISEDDTNNTIRLMVERGLGGIRQPRRSDWVPSGDDLRVFVTTCRGLPVLAEIRVREVSVLISHGLTLRDAFHIVKEDGMMSRSLKDDYLRILRRAYRDGVVAYYASNSSEPARSAMSNTESAISPYVLRTYRDVVGAVITAQEPLGVETISRILAISEETIRAALDPIGSIINVPASGDGPVRFYHATAKEFLTGPPHGDENDRDFFFSDKKGAFLALALLKVLNYNLKQNVANTPNLIPLGDGSRVKEIPKHVAYAANYLPTHLDLSSASEELWGELRLFLTTKLLFWLELGHQTQEVSVKEMLQQRKYFVGINADLPRLLDDVIPITSFKGDPREIYRMLPFLPPSSPVLAYYNKLSDPAVRVLRVPVDMSLLVNEDLPHDEASVAPIACAALSDDGCHVVLGFSDGAVQVVDAELGHRIARFADKPPNPSVWLLFIDEGHKLVTEDSEGDIYILDNLTSCYQQVGSRCNGTDATASLSHNRSMIVRAAQQLGNEWYEAMSIICVTAEDPTINPLHPPSRTIDRHPEKQRFPLRRSMGFSPDGHYVGAFDTKVALVWSSTSFQVIAQHSVDDPAAWFLNAHNLLATPPLQLPGSVIVTPVPGRSAFDGVRSPSYALLTLDYPMMGFPSPGFSRIRTVSSVTGAALVVGSRGGVWFRGYKTLTIPAGYCDPTARSIKVSSPSSAAFNEESLADFTLPISCDSTRFLLCDEGGFPAVVDISGLVSRDFAV